MRTTRRLLESVGVVMVLAAVIVLLRLTTMPVAGQAPSTTAWGHLNLEGIWLDVYATPLKSGPNGILSPSPGRSFERGERGTAQDVSSVFASVSFIGSRSSSASCPPTA